MQCTHHQRGECGSCPRIAWSQDQQLAAHHTEATAALADWPDLRWETPLAAAESGFRNKAKWVVGGSWEAPLLGHRTADGQVVELDHCRLYPAALSEALPVLRDTIRAARLPPYDLDTRRGELKYVLLTLAPGTHELLLRFVLRSREGLDRLRMQLTTLRAALPMLRVISVNLQPVHQAILEGPEEILLSAEGHVVAILNGHRLHLPPQAFFQTHSEVAAALYATAAAWISGCTPTPQRVLDLYCGIGGFAQHAAAPGRSVLGIETSAAAVRAAQASVLVDTLHAPQFRQADATGLRDADLQADLIVVNPPRRGLGAELCAALDGGPARHLLYSSCNVHSLARDLHALPGYAPQRAQIFQMFPHTPHFETLVLLSRA